MTLAVQEPIHLVILHDYDDHEMEWIVAAFTAHEEAEKAAVDAVRSADEEIERPGQHFSSIHPLNLFRPITPKENTTNA